VNRVSGLDRSSFHGSLCWVGISSARGDVSQVGDGDSGVCLVTLIETRSAEECTVVLLGAFDGLLAYANGQLRYIDEGT